jgi:hypothetical protein
MVKFFNFILDTPGGVAKISISALAGRNADMLVSKVLNHPSGRLLLNRPCPNAWAAGSGPVGLVIGTASLIGGGCPNRKELFSPMDPANGSRRLTSKPGATVSFGKRKAKLHIDRGGCHCYFATDERLGQFAAGVSRRRR